MLRATVRAYLRCHQSSSSPARELHCHKNTVLYRLRLAEELLGRPVDADPLHLGLALQAVEWLGPPIGTPSG